MRRAHATRMHLVLYGIWQRRQPPAPSPSTTGRGVRLPRPAALLIFMDETERAQFAQTLSMYLGILDFGVLPQRPSQASPLHQTLQWASHRASYPQTSTAISESTMPTETRRFAFASTLVLQGCRKRIMIAPRKAPQILLG